MALATRDFDRDFEAMKAFDDVVNLETMGRDTGWLTAELCLQLMVGFGVEPLHSRVLVRAFDPTFCRDNGPSECLLALIITRRFALRR